jgi:hypothetical protein
LTELAHPLDRPRSSRLGIHLAAGAAVGAVVALTALQAGFITGRGGTWVRPENDLNAYLVAWHYYLADHWRWPLFSLPAMGYPEGGSVVLNDALPLAVLTSKLFFSLTGVAINPFGWWIFLTYVLQGLMAARLVRACGTQSIWASAAAAVMAVCCMGFMWRQGHTALSSHFLIIWALALHFESVRRNRLKLFEITLLWALAMLVNPYLFVMVALLTGATILQLLLRRQLTLTDMMGIAAGVLLIGTIAMVEGYGVVVTNPAAMKSGGMGF